MSASNFVITCPSLPEQQEIVRILDNLLENEQKAKELCDVIEHRPDEKSHPGPGVPWGTGDE